MTTAGGRQGLVRRFITRTHLDSMYSFKAVIEGSSASHLGGQLQGGDLVVRGGPETLVNLYGWWRQVMKSEPVKAVTTTSRLVDE